ncbi:serine hydrolase [Bellilinea sp.]
MGSFKFVPLSRNVYRFLLVMMTALFCLPTAGVSAKYFPAPADPAELEAFMDGVLASSMEAYHVPGAVVVVVCDGQTLLAKGYGYVDLESRQPVDPATSLFRPGSVSKLFTWTAVMQLVEAGKLDLDADVNTYLDFTIPDTFPEPITLRHILTHTPGFEDKGEGLFKLSAEEMIPLDRYLKHNLPARVFPPGKIAAYSNYAVALAGYIVERVSGQPFNSYIADHIFQPLGMQYATFEQPLPSELAGKMSNGYNYIRGKYIKGGFEYVVGGPAGALSASGLDMAKFMIAHLQEGEYEGARILEAQTARRMHTPLRTADPRLSGGMAYGFFFNTINGHYTLSHGGDTMLFHSFLLLLPESQTGFFVSTNGASGAQAVEQVVNAFMERYYPAQGTPLLIPAADFDSRAGQYAGAYHLARNNFTSYEKIISLLMPINVWVEDRQVFVEWGGDVTAYIENEAGLLVNPQKPHDRLVLRTDGGQVMLVPSLPFDFIKTPWYGSLPLHLLIFIGGSVLYLGALIGWLVSFWRGVRRRDLRPLGWRLARLSGGLFGLLFLVYMIGFGSALGTIEPAYGVPKVFFGIMPAGFDLLMQIPLLLLVLGGIMLVFSVVAWVKGYWQIGGRLFYSLTCLWALAILWSLSYWNLLAL